MFFGKPEKYSKPVKSIEGRREEIIRIDPLNNDIPYDWSLKHR